MENNKRAQFTFYRSYYDALLSMPRKEALNLFLAICAYALDKEETKLTGFAASAFALIRPTLDSGRNKANNRRGDKGEPNEDQNENKPRSNREQNRKEKEKEKEKEGEKEREKEGEYECTPPKPPGAQRRFSPPTVDEVEAYCRERGNGVSAQAFCDFYASKGWKVGNAPMKDWKAAVRTWEQREGRDRQNGGSDPYAGLEWL